MLIGYGDDHRSSLPAVLTSNHLVREVPQTLVPDERRAVLAHRPPRPRQHPRGTCCGIHTERSCHSPLLRSGSGSLASLLPTFVPTTMGRKAKHLLHNMLGLGVG